MMYAVFFEDDENYAEMRAKHMTEHLSFLTNNKTAIHAAGPLKDSATDTAAGGLWIVQADSSHIVQTLIEQDPFWPTGLRKSVRILAWTQVFANGDKLL